MAMSPSGLDQPVLDLLAVRLNQWEVDRRWLEHDLSNNVVVPIEFLDARKQVDEELHVGTHLGVFVEDVIL